MVAFICLIILLSLMYACVRFSFIFFVQKSVVAVQFVGSVATRFDRTGITVKTRKFTDIFINFA